MKKQLMTMSAIFLLISFIYVTAAAGEECADSDAACLIGVLKKGEGAPSLRAAMALGNLKSAEAVPVLVEKLKSKDQYMSTAAVHALANIGEPAVPALAEAADSHSAQVRRFSVYALGRIGGGAAVKTASKLTRDADAEVRREAAAALGKLQDKSALFDLVNLLQDRHRKVRLEALRSLSAMPDERVAIPVVDSGLSDLDSEVSMEAAGVLLKIGVAAIPVVIKDAQNRPAAMKVKICVLLGELGAMAEPAVKSQIEQALVSVLKNKNDPYDVRQAACVGLGSVGGKNAEAALQQVITDYQGNVAASVLVKAARDALQRVQSRKP